MLNVLVFTIIPLIVSSNAKIPETRYFPTKGEVWPKAWKENKTTTVYNVDPEKLEYKITGKNCEKIKISIQRCKDYINTLSNISKRKYSNRYSEYNVVTETRDNLKELRIHLTQDCEDYPYYDMIESYNLTVSDISVLNSTSVWGIIRGMETFSQLFYLTSNFKKVLVNKTAIIDKPHYPHRGLLLNTGSHFLSTENILKTIDAMAMNKMNLLHWRIVDDESFPYQSSKFPELSGDGAYHSSMVYTKADMEKIRDYAKDLGIRVMVEFDIPGHTYSLGLSHSEILTDCPNRKSYAPPLNPMKNETYSFLKELFTEIQELFPDSHIHIGGDDVEQECWDKDLQISKYMNTTNITCDQMLTIFYKKILPLFKPGTVLVVWDDVFDANVPLPSNTIIQTWDFHSKDHIGNALNAGYRAIQSAPFFLNELSHEIDWLYTQEPRLAIQEYLNNDTLLQNLVGVTACMWGEMVDDTNVLSRTWTRASGVAEVLWSDTDGSRPDELVMKRIEEHACRMRRRGVPASPPTGPGFCLL